MTTDVAASSDETAAIHTKVSTYVYTDGLLLGKLALIQPTVEIGSKTCAIRFPMLRLTASATNTLIYTLLS
jgi:hypothetical protein